MSGPGRMRVDVCICTFRRTYLSETLRSVSACADSAVDMRIIVADNDTVPSAQPLVDAFASEVAFPVIYLHAPDRNISLARNACLDAASADFIAFVDDDEHVTPQWLKALIQAAETTEADVVLGPVTAVYSDDAPGWMRRGDFHSTVPAYVNGSIQTGYTCNVLMRCKEPFRALQFDIALGRSGGEDTDYFYRLRDLGACIVFASDALVYEPVPAERAQMIWLLRRRLRSGQTYGTQLIRSSKNRWTSIALASAKSGYCLAMAGLTIFSPVLWRRNILRGALHIGVIGGLLEAKQAALYGDRGVAPASGDREQ